MDRRLREASENADAWQHSLVYMKAHAMGDIIIMRSGTLLEVGFGRIPLGLFPAAVGGQPARMGC
jgi:hypothetical protein